jgi:tetratricopeptide (TPR) repeat protein
VRLFAALLAIPALALAALGAESFWAETEALIGSRQEAQAATQDAALASVADAVRLQAWNPGYRSLYAEDLQRAGQIEAARAQLVQALRVDPAAPVQWLRLELLSAQADPRDPLALTAAQAVVRLGPNDPDIQGSQADLGVRAWQGAPEALRALWRPSIRFTLRHARGPFLMRTFRSAGEDNLCLAAPELHDWCARARMYRSACLRPDLNLGQARWCELMGTSPAEVPSGDSPP